MRQFCAVAARWSVRVPSSLVEPVDDQLRELLVSHAPVLRFDDRELFHPAAVDEFAAASLLEFEGEILGGEDRPVTLAELDHRWAPGTNLQFITDADRRLAVGDEAKRFARRLFSPRLGRVGLFGRLLDALFQLSVLVRSTSPNRTTTAAALKSARLGISDAQPVCYGRALRAGPWLVLHYAYFYVMNDWRTGYRGLNDHEGDWEQAWVFCDPLTRAPVWVAASSHEHEGGDLRRHWDDPELSKVGDRPVLFAGAGSHALYFAPGDYVTRIEVPGLQWALRLQRWFQRLLRIRDQATERGLGPALGVPFVDIASGSGREIADWDLRVMSPDWCWLEDFRGLWGLDTHDSLGGERGPSGPKFQRNGDVRVSWADPVGFAGLHGTPPPEHHHGADEVIDHAEPTDLARLDKALDDLDDQIKRLTNLLPLANRVANSTEIQDESKRLTELLQQRSDLQDLRRRAAEPAEPTDIRSHIVHPAVPLEPPAASGWLLAMWAAASIPMILLSVAALLVFESLSVAGLTVAVAAGALLLEQLVRRRYQAAFRLLVIYVAAVAFVLFALSFVLGGAVLVGRYALGAALTIAAVFLFVANLSELRTVAGGRADTS